MRFKRIVLLSLLLLVLSSALLLANDLNLEEQQVVIREIEGEVYHSSSGFWIFSGRWKEAREGMIISEGEQVKTGDNSSSELVFLSGARVIVTENSQVELYKNEKTQELQLQQLDLKAGRVIVDFFEKLKEKSSFEIKTPSAVTGIRGTSFSVEVDKGGSTSVMVGSGEVEVASAVDRTSVRAGEKAEVMTEDSTVNVSRFDPAEDKSWQEEKKQLDKGATSKEEIKEEVKEKIANFARRGKRQKPENPPGQSDNGKPEDPPGQSNSEEANESPSQSESNKGKSEEDPSQSDNAKPENPPGQSNKGNSNNNSAK